MRGSTQSLGEKPNHLLYRIQAGCQDASLEPSALKSSGGKYALSWGDVEVRFHQGAWLGGAYLAVMF